MMPTLRECFNSVKKVVFRLLIPINYRLSRVLGKLCIFYNELMEIVTQKIGARIAAMSIKYSKETTLRPIFNIFFRRWLHNIKHNANSIFIVVSNNALIRIGCVAHNETILPYTAFCRLPTWQVESAWIRWWTVSEKKFLNVKWLVILILTRRPI